jgi:myosin heavy subunit
MTTQTDDLNTLRTTITNLSNYQLPAHYAEHTDEISAFPNPRLLKRYKTAKSTYIHRRTLQMFVETMNTYDADSNQFTLPQVSEEELTKQKTKNERVLSAIRGTMDRIITLRKDNTRNYHEFEKKREELSDIVSKMERSTSESDDDTDDVEITEEEAEKQDEELNRLAERREMLEHKLRLVRGQISHLESEVDETQRAVNEVRSKTGRAPIDWGEEDKKEGDVCYFSVKESVDAEVAELREKIEELKESSVRYDNMRELMEELGGVKVLETEKEGEGGYVIKLMMLGSHILELTLEKKDTGLHVQNAKLLTSMSLAVPRANEEDTTNLMETMHSISVSNLSFSKIMSQKPSEAVNIPPLDDLVSYSQDLEPSHGIRFIVSETLARIRTVTSRIVELTHLKSKYAAQIYDIESGEQEVVCALNEGISIALRLGADCPLVKGSVYISELCGVGGWEEAKLQELKKTVDEKRCRGPVEVMEVLVEEIQRRRKEEGWVLPLTPVLMRGSGCD